MQRLRRRPQHECSGAEVDVGGAEVERPGGEGNDGLVAVADDDRNARSRLGRCVPNAMRRCRSPAAAPRAECRRVRGAPPTSRARNGDQRRVRAAVDASARRGAPRAGDAAGRMRAAPHASCDCAAALAHFGQVIEAPAQLARAVVRRELAGPSAAARPRRGARVRCSQAALRVSCQERTGDKRAAVVRVPADEARPLDGEAGGRPARGSERCARARPSAVSTLAMISSGSCSTCPSELRCVAIVTSAAPSSDAVGCVCACARCMSALVDGDIDVARHAGSGDLARPVRRRAGKAPSTRPSRRRARRARAQAGHPSPRRRPRPRRPTARRAPAGRRPVIAEHVLGMHQFQHGPQLAGSPSSTHPIGTPAAVRASRHGVGIEGNDDAAVEHGRDGPRGSRSMQCARP